MSLASGSARRPLRYVVGDRDLRRLLGASLVSQTGDWALAVGLSYAVYALTGSPLASAALLLAQQVPQVVLGSLAGVLADRCDRRRLMVVVDVVMAAALVPLAVVRGASTVWVVDLVVATTSAASAAFVAAEAALLPALPALVERPDALVAANAVNAQLRSLARLLGAALGGVAAAAGGPLLLAAADATSFLVSAALIAGVRGGGTPARSAERAPGRVRRDWADGVAALARSRVLGVLLAFAALTGLGEGVMGTLFAPFVRDALGGSARAYGAVLAVQAVGGVLGGAVVTVRGGATPPRWLLGVGALAFGVGDLALFLLPPALPAGARLGAAAALIAAVGLPGAAVAAGSATLFQRATADADRGRVFGALSTVTGALALVSAPVAGELASGLGVVAVICAQGAAYAVAGLVVLAALGGGAHDPVPGRREGGRRTAPGGRVDELV